MSPDIPDFSAPAPDMVRVAVSGPVALALPTYAFVIRDLKGGAEYLDETRIGRSFVEAVQDLDDAQVPLGFEIARVVCIDIVAGRIADATIRVIEEVARRYEARCEPEYFPKCLHAACEAHGIALPEIDDEGAIDSGLIRAAHRRGAEVADLIGEAA